MSHVNIVEKPVKSNCDLICEGSIKRKANKKKRKEVPMLSAVEKRERRKRVQESTDRTRRTFMNQRLEVLRQRQKGESRSARNNELIKSRLLRYASRLCCGKMRLLYSRFAALDSWDRHDSTSARLWVAFDQNPGPPRLLQKGSGGGGGGTRFWIALDGKSNNSLKFDLENTKSDNITDEQTDSGINSDTYVVDVPVYAEEGAAVTSANALGVEPSDEPSPAPPLRGSTSARIISTLKSILCTSYRYLRQKRLLCGCSQAFNS